jgi:hypothetical protein
VNFRPQFAGTGHDLSRWLVLLLLALGVLAPAACVLWFMNEAMTNQRDAARQKLAEAYRGQLQLVRDRLDAAWEKRAADLDREAASGAAPAAFERSVRNGLADAVVVLNADGSAGYPSAAVPLRADRLDRRAVARKPAILFRSGRFVRRHRQGGRRHLRGGARHAGVHPLPGAQWREGGGHPRHRGALHQRPFDAWNRCGGPDCRRR